MGIAFQRLVLGLLIFLSCIGTLVAKAHAYPAELETIPYEMGIEIGAGALAERGRSLAPMLSDNARLARLVAPVSGLEEQRQLAYVQAVIGELIAWRSDADLYGRRDRWAAPRETLARRAGDCEDIAILKLAALANLGFAPERLALVVGRDSVRGDHAIAAVRSKDGWRLLDDDGKVRDAAALTRFEPIYSLVAGRAYLHGRTASVRPAGR